MQAPLAIPERACYHGEVLADNEQPERSELVTLPSINQLASIHGSRLLSRAICNDKQKAD